MKQWMKKGETSGPASRRDLVILALAIVVVLFVFNFLSSRHFIRVDLTEGNEYTLSDSTRSILKNLDDVVNIKIYFSKDLPPALMMLRRDVDDLLSEYQTYAVGKVKVQYVDPQETQQIEGQIQMMGIPPVQVNVIEKDKHELVKLYLGMTVAHEDRKEILPVVQNTLNLEYDLTAAILQVTQKERPLIKWWTRGEGLAYKNIQEMLKRRYTIQEIAGGDLDLMPNRDALLVLALDSDLTDDELFAVDQYLMGGGKILLMVDRTRIENKLQVSATDVSNVVSWLGHFKIEVSDRLLLDRSNSYAAFSGGHVTYQVPYPYFVKVRSDGFDPDSPIVSDLDTLIFPWISPIELGILNKESGVSSVILAESSIFNKPVEMGESLMPEKAGMMLGGTRSEPKPLVVLTSGKLTSAFGEEGKMPAVSGVEPLKVSENGQLMVIGNTRFVQDRFIAQFRPNTLFFENAVDSMAMGGQLIGIRSKGVTDRPIEELSPAGIALVKYSNILGPPLLLVVVGLIIIFLNRQKRHLLRTVYITESAK